MCVGGARVLNPLQTAFVGLFFARPRSVSHMSVYLRGGWETRGALAVRWLVVVPVFLGQRRPGLLHLLSFLCAPAAVGAARVDHHAELLAHVGHLIWKRESGTEFQDTCSNGLSNDMWHCRKQAYLHILLNICWYNVFLIYDIIIFENILNVHFSHALVIYADMCWKWWHILLENVFLESIQEYFVVIYKKMQ